MSGHPPGNRPSPAQSDVYWRRRVIALAAAIGVLALVAWTVNGALGGGANAKQAADATHTGQHGHHGISAVAATSPASPGTATPTPAGPATPRPSTQATAKHGQGQPGQGKHGQGQRGQGQHGQGQHGQGQHGQGQHGSNRAGSGAATASHAAACPRGSVVLSLFTSKYRYLARQAPRFQLDVVSTAPRPCSFGLGAKNVQLVIKAGGERRVWDSADCVRLAGHRMGRLTRGVPAVLRISWDRKTSAAGCRLPGQPARPGTYTATARSGPLRSPALIFVLAGRGIAVP